MDRFMMASGGPNSGILHTSRRVAWSLIPRVRFLKKKKNTWQEHRKEETEELNLLYL